MFWKLRKKKQTGRKFIVFHNHIFKNAGSTIDWALKKNFGKRFVDHRDDDGMRKDPKYLQKYIQAHPKICALSSHHLCLPLPHFDHTDAFTLMMFRHPIERVASVYNFERRQTQSDTLGARFAREHDLKTYVEWRLQYDVPPTIRNFHLTKALPTPVRWRQPADKADLEQAMDYVDSVMLLGIVEHFDESMILFEKKMHSVCPEIDLSYRIQNVGQHRREPQLARIEKLRESLGESLYSELVDKNWADLLLYEHAMNLFKERRSHVDSLATLIERFRKRCDRRGQ